MIMKAQQQGVPVTITGRFKRKGHKWYNATSAAGWKITGPAEAFVLEGDQWYAIPADLNPSVNLKKLEKWQRA